MKTYQWRLRPYDWMIKYTRQTEWIDRKGIFLWLAFYCGGLGGGLYLVSLYFNSLWGMFISWLIILVLKGGCHLVYLGKPLRFWRIVLKPQTSCVARGLILVVLFVGFAGVQLALSYWLPGSAWEVIFKVLAGIAAFGVAMYTGFALNVIKAVPFWNSALLPVLFIAFGVLGGLGLSVLIALGGGDIDIAAAEVGVRWLLIINAILIVMYLWTATYMGPTAKYTVMEQIRGSLASIFWVGVVLLGIVIPIAISITSYFAGEVSSALLLIAVISEIIGGLALRYVILKAGIYRPLLPMASE